MKEQKDRYLKDKLSRMSGFFNCSEFVVVDTKPFIIRKITKKDSNFSYICFSPGELSLKLQSLGFFPEVASPVADLVYKGKIAKINLELEKIIVDNKVFQNVLRFSPLPSYFLKIHGINSSSIKGLECKPIKESRYEKKLSNFEKNKPVKRG